MIVQIPYDNTHLALEIPDARIASVVTPWLDTYEPEAGEEELIRRALAQPIGSPTLEELARRGRCGCAGDTDPHQAAEVPGPDEQPRAGQKVVVIASDHTRPVPSRLLMPPILEAIRRGDPEAEITILIATGCHRGTTKEELVGKFGEEIVRNERIVVHDCADENALATIGRLPSGGVLRINRLAAEADLVVSEGFIEPHFFAGFSGGRKSILPGIAARETVYWNHNAGFIADPHARAGILEDNPIHRDMIYAARAARLAFILNVVINSKHEVIGAFAGDCEAAHLAGVSLVRRLCAVKAPKADIVITSNNGYPLDQNIYQAVKGMSTAEAVCREGGVIIMAAGCRDGHGGKTFTETFQQEKSAAEILQEIESVAPGETVADQWQSQIFARILAHHTVILLSLADPALVRSMKMLPAASLQEALRIADGIVGKEAKVTVIPEGISAIVEAEE